MYVQQGTKDLNVYTYSKVPSNMHYAYGFLSSAPAIIRKEDHLRNVDLDRFRILEFHQKVPTSQSK